MLHVEDKLFEELPIANQSFIAIHRASYEQDGGRIFKKNYDFFWGNKKL